MKFYPHATVALFIGSITLTTGLNFTNPVIYEDLADLEVIRVNDTYYYTASTMHFSPGAPILRSYDLVNWEYLSHSVPHLDFGPEYSLQDSRTAYDGGVWASTLQYRHSNGLWYWYGLIQSTGKTHVFTAPAPEGPWTEHTPMDEAYYDCGLLIDPDDDTMYIAYGNYVLHVAQLSSDGLSQVKSEAVYTEPDGRLIEGSRMYKRDGNYYIFATKPANEQHILKSTTGPFGPYEIQAVLVDMPAPVVGAGTPHQGGLVETPSGDWYYMAFIDAFPLGRCPVLAPITWDSNGWPHVVTDAAGGWGAEYAMPVSTDRKAGPENLPGAFKEIFSGKASLGPRWEWNHNPLDSAWKLTQHGLELTTERLASELYTAPNTLTTRIFGPKSQATFKLDLSMMKDGDRAGVSIFRDDSAYIGVHQDSGVKRLVYVDNLVLNQTTWIPTGHAGDILAGDEVRDGAIWLRVTADVRPAFTSDLFNDPRPATFWYSTNGIDFTQFGNTYLLSHKWQFFMAYRFAVFNYATVELGGKIVVEECETQELR
ncbi:putative beta-xylosidase [Ceratocystis fimbriata CBS 114723]|uniref:Putative beta-xylosidase n=1 Tax=Ceratocystis fimbriata CBS 114723 TaxID=1035309 RepID=A0A2C5WDS7_9PEZI|nr:putative beta-xylosidase [Ceratocystis fimbriata CBS 114723]